MEHMTSKLGKWLKQEIASRGWSIRETARHAGVSHTAVNNALAARGATSLDTYKGLARAFDMSLEDVLRSAGELPPTVDEQRALNPTLDEGIRILTELPPGDQAMAVRALRGLRLTAKPTQEAQLAPEIEQMFDSIAGATDGTRKDRRHVFVESVKTLVRLSTPEQLAQMEAHFRRKLAELGPDHNT
jgi:transcriptional regulator with XRE-family HTH domain